MGERRASCNVRGVSTRRQVMAGAGAVLGSLAFGSGGRANAQETMEHAPSSSAHQVLTSLHQEVSLPASPMRVYKILLDSSEFAAFSGMPAKIDPIAGGAFTMFSGRIAGRNVELVPGRRIVQAWRPSSWGPGVYSIVRFELNARGPETLVALDHTGFPAGEFDHLFPGWKMRYWDPLAKYLQA
jgi:activator of HSP90 ATPase